MKILKKSIIIIGILGAIIASYRYWIVSKSKESATNLFLKNIKSGIKNEITDVPDSLLSKFPKFDGYNFETFKNEQVTEISSGKTMFLKDVLNRPNLFINFWYKGCAGCEFEMPDIQKFHDNYRDKIGFVIISNDDIDTDKEYVQKHSFSMPFYVLKDNTFPTDIRIFPTSHLITNSTTKFVYAGMGQYDSQEFNHYVDSVLTK
jgi:thiol-disulfide isomerase/thioredoxin